MTATALHSGSVNRPTQLLTGTSKARDLTGRPAMPCTLKFDDREVAQVSGASLWRGTLGKRSRGFQILDKLSFLFSAQTQLEVPVIVVDDLVERREPAVMVEAALVDFVHAPQRS
jgi:hypothetical protein